jgi:phage shock protein C
MASSYNRRLYRSIEYRVFTGVASGIADYFNTSHTSIRYLFILLSLASGLGLIFYLTLSVLLPTEEEILL